MFSKNALFSQPQFSWGATQNSPPSEGGDIPVSAGIGVVKMSPYLIPTHFQIAPREYSSCSVIVLVLHHTASDPP
jgi:hypothetical protein